MAPSKQTRAGRAMLAMGAVAAFYAAGSAFLASGAQGASSLRGQTRQYEPLAQHAPPAPAADTVSLGSGIPTSLMAAGVAFGLVAGIATAPVQAAVSGVQTTVAKTVDVSDSSLSFSMKTFVNPSDELDPDEQPFEDWSAENPVQLILTGLIPVFIYLTFYILGSLEVI
eukprot:TRINITY_DN6902_c1_g1_i1.p1 TRINITY_DN6902_c1_g1~~TRINITY_DN6902_c1_g1_i1.p1  ORF type:complete len:197 (-),score=24.82 TRINITY_DN6902_c1_g1_i1:241-747(-)